MALIQSDPDHVVSEVSSTDLEQIRKWNETVPATVEACVHHLVEEQVHDHPDDEAVCSREGSLTYRELDTYANKLARRLVLQNVKPDDLVPVRLEKPMWTVVAMLGVLKTGAAFVPMPFSPVQRIVAILSLINHTVILTSPQQAKTFQDMNEHVMIMEKGLFDMAEADNVEPLRVGMTASNLAYVLFTSGSTGTPKGAQIEHSQLCTHLKTWGEFMNLDHTCRVFQFAAHVFDAAMAEVFLPLIYGGTVCIPSEDDRMNNIAGSMKDMRVTYTFFTPSLLSALRPEDFDLATLKTLVIGGELPPPDLLTLWASVPEVEVFNGYGPTECCIMCCAANITRDGPRAGNIGRAIGDTFWIVHASDVNKLAAIGEVGELLIEGPTVGRGYIGADEKSAAAFVQPPSWLRRIRSDGNQRLYRTGDLVKYCPDGTIEFLERKDHQVKLRGQRMELGEVEYQLRRVLPSRTAVVADIISEESSGGEPILVAFICREDLTKSKIGFSLVTDSAIMQHFGDLITSIKPELIETLPSYMIPSSIVAMESMPYLDSSKIDRKGLRKSYANSLSRPNNDLIASDARESQCSPLTDTEKKLQHIWAEAFRIAPSRINLNDSFFQLGGDSVIAIRLVAIARRAGVFVTVRMLFNHPKITQLAAVVWPSISTTKEKGMPEPFTLLGDEVSLIKDLCLEAVTQCGINLDMIQDIYPTPIQHEAWMAAPEVRASIVFPLPAQVDLERYLQCWRRLIASHDMMRTRMIKTETGVYSVVTTEAPNIRTATNLDTFIAEEKKSMVDFGDALSTFCLIKDPNDAHKTCFVWIAHHIVYDEWTIEAVNIKLQRAYADLNLAFKEELKPKQLVQHFQSLDRTAIHDYWRSHYAGVIFKPLFSRPADRYWEADQETSLRINLFPPNKSRGPRFTLSATITIAWALALSRKFQVSDLALAIIRSGRSLPVEGIENYVGVLVTLPAWHVHIDENALTQDVLNAFQRTFWESTDHEAVGLQELMALSPEAAAAGSHNVWLNIHAKDMEAEEQDGTQRDELPAPSESAFYPVPVPVMLSCHVDRQGMSAIAAHDRSIDRKVIQELLDAFGKALKGLLSGAGEEGQRICDVAS